MRPLCEGGVACQERCEKGGGVGQGEWGDKDGGIGRDKRSS